MSTRAKHVIKRLLYSGLPVPRWVRPLVRLMYRVGVWMVEAMAFARKVFWIEPVLRSVCADVGQRLRAERLPYMRGKGILKFGDDVNLSGRSCFYFMSGMSERPEIKVGNRTFIGNGCTFSAGKEIVLGEGCLISTFVRIADNDGHPLDPERRRRGDPILQNEAREVRIGNNVWIGAHAMVMKGVTIGDDAVVAAASVVTHDVAHGAVVAGNPARVVRMLTEEENTPHLNPLPQGARTDGNLLPLPSGERAGVRVEIEAT